MTGAAFGVILVELSEIIVSLNETIWYDFWKKKRNLKKCLTTWNKCVKVIKSLEQRRQSQFRRTVPKSGRVRKTLKKVLDKEKEMW